MPPEQHPFGHVSALHTGAPLEASPVEGVQPPSKLQVLPGPFSDVQSWHASEFAEPGRPHTLVACMAYGTHREPRQHPAQLLSSHSALASMMLASGVALASAVVDDAESSDASGRCDGPGDTALGCGAEVDGAPDALGVIAASPFGSAGVPDSLGVSVAAEKAGPHAHRAQSTMSTRIRPGSYALARGAQRLFRSPEPRRRIGSR